MPASTTSSELIALVGLTWHAKAYEPGDRFEPKQQLAPHERRVVDRMVHGTARKLGVLSAETMAIALERRPVGAGVPSGFTLDGLRVLNFVTDEQIKRFGWEDDDDDAEGGEQQQQQQQEPAPEADRPEWLAKDAEAYAVDDLWVVRAKANGGPPRYDVVDGKGERVLPGGTIAGKDNAVKKAQTFLEARGPAPAPATEQQQQQEPADEAAEHEAKIRALADADVESMDDAALTAWLKAQDMHAPEGTTTPDKLAAAQKIRDAAKEALAKLEAAAPETNQPAATEGAPDGSDVQPGPQQ